MSTVRVLRIINRFNLGGPTYNAAYLTKYLPAPFETLLIGGEHEESEGSSQHILDNIGVNATIIPEMSRAVNLKSDLKAYRRILAIIKEYKPHIVHTHASKAGALGRFAANKCNVPVIVHTFHGHVFHSYFGKPKTLLYKNIERNLAKKSSAIVAISNIQKHELVDIHDICPADKAHVIPLGFDLERFQINMPDKRKAFREKFSIQKDEIAIGIIGRLVPIKNHKYFIDVLKKIKVLGKPIKAFIIGDGSEKEQLENYSKQLGFTVYNSKTPPKETNSITFTSWIQDIDYVMAGLDIVCLTSLNEGTPVSIIEALAAKKPVLSTKIGGIEDIIQDGKNGFLCNIGNIDSYCTKLIQLIDNEQIRSSVGSSNFERTFQNYHYSSLITNTQNLYEKLLQ